jgi:uncharacterized protein (TIGR03083 family)
MEELAPERNVKEIASALEKEMPALIDAWRAIPAGTVFVWHADLSLPIEVIAGLVLSDVLVHTVDLGRALGERMPIPKADAIAAFDAVVPVIPNFLSPEGQRFDGVFDIALRDGPRYAFAFADGGVTITSEKPATAVCRMNGDPATLLLVSYGRIPPWRAALAGKVMAYGRKPWLAFRFPSFIRNP